MKPIRSLPVCRRLPLVATALATLVALLASCGTAARTPQPTLPSVEAAATGASASTTDAWTGRDDLIAAPAPAPLAAIAFPEPIQFRLANGMTVLVVASAELPMVSAQLAIANGWSADPADQAGTAAFVAQMLMRGTTSRDAAAFDRAMAATGGTISSDASYEATVVKCDAQASYAGTCLALMADAVIAPRFAVGEMASVGERLAGQVKATEESPAALAAVHAQNLLWSNAHPRGRTMSMASLRSITRDTLVRWHKAANRPERAILVIVGDVNAAEIKRLATAQFAKWRGQGPALAKTPEATPIAARAIRLVDLPGQPQAQLALAIPGLAHQDSRFFDTLVWNHILGGSGYASRLSSVLRAGAGASGARTPGAATTFDRNGDRGAWVATTAARASEAGATLTILLREIKKMQATGPTDQEVAEAIANLGGSYAMRFDSASALAGGLLAAALHDFDASYVKNFPVVLGKSDRASVAGAAAELLATHSLAIALVGDAKVIAPQLEKLGLPFERVAAADPVTPVAFTPPPEDPKLTAKAQLTLAAALKKKGGRAALESRKSLRLTARGAMKKGTQVIDVALTRLWSLPGASRVDLVLNQAIRISYAMGAGGSWQDTPNGLVDVPEADAATVERERWLDPDFILLRSLAPGAAVRWVGEETIAGAVLYKINITSPDKRFTATLFIDAKTKLVSMVAFPESTGVGTIALEDYKPVDGILVAHKRTTLGGDETVTLVVSQFEWNVPVSDAMFAKPAVSANASREAAPAPATTPAPAAPATPKPPAIPTPPATQSGAKP